MIWCLFIRRWIGLSQDLGLLPPVEGMGQESLAVHALEVAKFLRECPGLDRRVCSWEDGFLLASFIMNEVLQFLCCMQVIGDWLSEPADRNPFNDLVLRAFTQSFDFAKQGFVKAKTTTPCW